MRALPALLLVCAAQGAAAQAPASTSQFAWLAGCWAHASGESGAGEQWTAPAGGLMLGVARTLRRGQAVSHEFMQIRDTPRGPVFIALPSGQQETTFELQVADARRVAFHNPAHDFPQRVIYEAADADTRSARFTMKRTACPLGATP